MGGLEARRDEQHGTWLSFQPGLGIHLGQVAQAVPTSTPARAPQVATANHPLSPTPMLRSKSGESRSLGGGFGALTGMPAFKSPSFVNKRGPSALPPRKVSSPTLYNFTRSVAYFFLVLSSIPTSVQRSRTGRKTSRMTTTTSPPRRRSRLPTSTRPLSTPQSSWTSTGSLSERSTSTKSFRSGTREGRM